jgi:hypothetical protein
MEKPLRYFRIAVFVAAAVLAVFIILRHFGAV